MDDPTFGGGASSTGFETGGFFAAQIDHGESQGKPVGAGQYSFFGNLDAEDTELELDGGLEDGISAPPAEDSLFPPAEPEVDLQVDLGDTDPDFAATSDLGISAMLGNMGLQGAAGLTDKVLDPVVVAPSGAPPLPMPSAALRTAGLKALTGLPSGAAPGAQRSPAGSLGYTSPILLATDTGGLIGQNASQQPQLLFPGLAQMPSLPQPAVPPAGVSLMPGPMGVAELEARMASPRPGHLQHLPPGPPPMAAPKPPPAPSSWFSGPMAQPPQHQPQPGSMPQPSVPPPPPPQGRPRSQSPVPRQPSPHNAGQHQQQGGGGFGIGYINKHQGPAHSHYGYSGHRRVRYRGKYMPEDTINHILRIQWAAVHASRPYSEDYYYQAFVAKHSNGANAAVFAPDTLRETAPMDRAGDAKTTFVPIEGLGKIAQSNIRRPRPLMDLSVAPVAGQNGSAGSGEAQDNETHRPLEQEPRLAARIMVEDLNSLLLDVDDIERIFRRAVATGQRVEGADSLVRRRAILLESMASSLRLPERAIGPSVTSAGDTLDDGVFLRLMTLPKGRRLLGRTIRRLFSPFDPQDGPSSLAELRMLWAVLRNLRALFGAMPPEDPVVAVATVSKEASAAAAAESRAAALAATAGVSAAIAEATHRLSSRRACVDALKAVVGGDLPPESVGTNVAAEALLPLLSPAGLQPGEFTACWAGDVVAALLERANFLGLGRAAQGEALQPGSEGATDRSQWEETFPRLMEIISNHVGVVQQVYRAAKAQGVVEGIHYARAIVPIKVVRAALLHATDQQREQLRSCLAELT